MLQFLKNLCGFARYLLEEKKNNVINKTLANIVRYELASGKKVDGKFHLEEALEAISQLEKWIENNPTASSNDRAVAENILLDLKDAIGEKPWYSQTKPPKY